MLIYVKNPIYDIIKVQVAIEWGVTMSQIIIGRKLKISLTVD